MTTHGRGPRLCEIGWLQFIDNLILNSPRISYLAKYGIRLLTGGACYLGDVILAPQQPQKRVSKSLFAAREFPDSMLIN